jgi:hypothetical protein
MLHLKVRDLEELCSTNKNVNQICHDDYFWQEKFKHDNIQFYLPEIPPISWINYYHNVQILKNGLFYICLPKLPDQEVINQLQTSFDIENLFLTGTYILYFKSVNAHGYHVMLYSKHKTSYFSAQSTQFESLLKFFLDRNYRIDNNSQMFITDQTIYSYPPIIVLDYNNLDNYNIKALNKLYYIYKR